MGRVLSVDLATTDVAAHDGHYGEEHPRIEESAGALQAELDDENQRAREGDEKERVPLAIYLRPRPAPHFGDCSISFATSAVHPV